MILDEMQVLADILKRNLQQIQKKNPKYSLRAFAKMLGVSSAALSEILNQKRTVSKNKALSLTSKLSLSDRDRARLAAAFENTKTLAQFKKRPNRRVEVIIDKSEFDIMSDWRYFAFMALTRTSDFKSDNKWIAQRLALDEKSVNKIIERLKSLNIISIDWKGNIKDNNACYRTSEDFPDKLIRARQLEGLTVLTKILDKGHPLQFGCFSTITTDIKKLADAKIMTEDFLKKLSLFLCDSPERTEVFELQIQLFPRTKS